MMQRRVEMMLLEPIDDYFHYGTAGLGAALRPWRMPDWAGTREWGQRRGKQAIESLPYFDDELADRPFLAGENFSMPDITLFAALAFAEGAGLAVPSHLSSLAAWRTRMSGLPAVKNRSGKEFLPQDLARRGR